MESFFGLSVSIFILAGTWALIVEVQKDIAIDNNKTTHTVQVSRIENQERA